MSAQPPGELTPTAEAVRGLVVHQPPALLRSQLLLKLQGVRLLPQSVFVPEGFPERVQSQSVGFLMIY